MLFLGFIQRRTNQQIWRSSTLEDVYISLSKSAGEKMEYVNEADEQPKDVAGKQSGDAGK